MSRVGAKLGKQGFMDHGPDFPIALDPSERPSVPPSQSAGVDELLTKAYEREAARDLPAVETIVNQILRAGHYNAPVGLLFARLAQEVGREEEALGIVQRVLDDSSPHPPRERASLHFAAAQLLDRMGKFQEAFEQATRANAQTARSYDNSHYAPARLEQAISHCIEIFAPAKLSAYARATNVDKTPVFIVGMPRSGSTLVEQVLASHPQVFGGGELQWVHRLWHSLLKRVGVRDEQLQEALARMTPPDANAVAAEYLMALHGLCPIAARVIDKNLANVMHVGLIWALFPGARVIHCRRDPMDTCLSCYMTDFAEVLPFTSSLTAVGHFHRQVDRLMAHWKQALDLPILEVDYEAVVADLEGHARRLLDFVELPWDEACLQFHRNPRRVETASKAQVRRPLYNSSIQRWRRYERWLGPLREALGL